MTSKRIFFKTQPTHTLPLRPGPVQCVRNCTNCIIKHDYPIDTDTENIIAIKSYENLVIRKSLWFSKYQSIQYHPGQIELLKRTIWSERSQLNIYVVAATRLEDLKFLKMVMSHERVPRMHLIDSESASKLDFIELRKHVLVPIKMKSCTVRNGSQENLLEVRGLRDFLEPIVGKVMNNSDYQVNIVPVVISKDHDKPVFFGIGSVCIQVLEPYSLREYVNNLRTSHVTGHLVQHLYYDLARNVARLPCHIVAFLLLYLDRSDGVAHKDLVEYLEWFKKAAELNMQTAFTGDHDDIIKFALMVLKDYVHIDSKSLIYRTVNIDALTDYANSITPNIVYYGIISRAILMLHNRDEKNTLMIKFSPNVRVRVMRDDVLELAESMAESMDNFIPCRRPCSTVNSCILDVFSQMRTFGHYFKVDEPRVCPRTGFAGDYDSDEDYFLSKRDDPAFKSWITLTQRAHRLDRLNLFVNAIESYLN